MSGAHRSGVTVTDRRAWRAAAGVLALAAVVCLVMWGARSAGTSSPAQATPAPASVTESTAAPDADAPAGPGAQAAPAAPVLLAIPVIGVRTRLLQLGEQGDGTVEVPADPARAGWFRLGPPPGTSGSSVILGHVDSTSGPAVFYRLRELGRGDRIAVRLDDGTSVRFRVRSTTTYANADFPAQKVYARQGRSQLNLVTCGGDYDAARGGYQANVVVHAVRVA